MSVYAVNKFCRTVVHDQAVRESLRTEPQATLLNAMPPLADDELQALLRGDIGWLSRHGCNNFMLHNLGRFEVLGLDLPTFAARMRAEYRVERESWKRTGEWPERDAGGAAPTTLSEG